MFHSPCKHPGTGKVLVLVSFLLAGCAGSPFSDYRRTRVVSQLEFSKLLADPESYNGRTVILGGVIVQTVNEPQHTEVEVLQKPLDGSDEPEDTDISGGRFLIRCPGYLDSAVYAKGRAVTVAGEVQGQETRPLGKTNYRYPIIGCQRIHLWPVRMPPAAYPYPYSWYGPWGPWGWGAPGWYPYWYPY